MKRIVTQIPIKELWRENEALGLKKVQNLSKTEVKNVLLKGTCQFVVANVGFELEWISVNDCFDFWKSKVKDNIAEDWNSFYLEDYPDEFVFVASLWKGDIGVDVILLEKHH